MGFVSEVLKDVQGIQWYYIIGIAIFITLFVIIVYKTIRTPQKDMVSYKESIFDNDEVIHSNVIKNHNA